MTCDYRARKWRRVGSALWQTDKALWPETSLKRFETGTQQLCLAWNFSMFFLCFLASSFSPFTSPFFGFPILKSLPRIFLLCHNLYFSPRGRLQLPQGCSVFLALSMPRFKNHLEVFHQLTMLLDALWCSFQTSKYHKWKQTSHFAPSPTTETEGWNIEKKRIAPPPIPAAPLSFFSLKDWPGLPVDMKKVWNQSDPANKSHLGEPSLDAKMVIQFESIWNKSAAIGQ